MAQVHLTVGGQPYQLACKDGDEDRLQQLAAQIDARMQNLIGVLGNVGERRLLLMIALQLADEMSGNGQTVLQEVGTEPSDKWMIEMERALEQTVSRVNLITRGIDEAS